MTSDNQGVTEAKTQPQHHRSYRRHYNHHSQQQDQPKQQQAKQQQSKSKQLKAAAAADADVKDQSEDMYNSSAPPSRSSESASPDVLILQRPASAGFADAGSQQQHQQQQASNVRQPRGQMQTILSRLAGSSGNTAQAVGGGGHAQGTGLETTYTPAISELQHQLEHSIASRAHIEQQLLHATRVLASEEQRYAQYREQEAALVAKMEEEQLARRQAEGQLAAVMAAHEQELGLLRSRTVEAEGALQAAQQQLHLLEGEAQEATDRCQFLEREADEQRAELQALQQEVREAQESGRRSEEQANQQGTRAEQLQQQLAELQHAHRVMLTDRDQMSAFYQQRLRNAEDFAREQEKKYLELRQHIAAGLGHAQHSMQAAAPHGGGMLGGSQPPTPAFAYPPQPSFFQQQRPATSHDNLSHEQQLAAPQALPLQSRVSDGGTPTHTEAPRRENTPTHFGTRLLSEEELAAVFLSLLPSDPNQAIHITRAEQAGIEAQLLPLTWVGDYQAIYGTMMDFIVARPGLFASRGDGSYYRAPRREARPLSSQQQQPEQQQQQQQQQQGPPVRGDTPQQQQQQQQDHRMISPADSICYPPPGFPNPTMRGPPPPPWRAGPMSTPANPGVGPTQPAPVSHALAYVDGTTPGQHIMPPGQQLLQRMQQQQQQQQQQHVVVTPFAPNYSARSSSAARPPQPPPQ